MSTSSRNLRTVDLARAAGLSTQAVRNYLDDGLLPEAARSPAGYRQFTQRHLDALQTLQALRGGFGWESSREIMRAVHEGNVPHALIVVEAVYADQHADRTSVHQVRQALEVVTADTPAAVVVPRGGLRIGVLAESLNVRTSALRVWESAGLIVPGRDDQGQRRYTAADARDAHAVKMLRQGDYPFGSIRTLLGEFRQTGSTEALQASVDQREADVGERARDLIEGAAVLHRYVSQVAEPATAAV